MTQMLPKGAVSVHADGLELDVPRLAPLIGLSPEGWREQMAQGRLLARAEQGQGEDEGRWRITLRHERTRVEIVLHPDGRAIARRLTGLSRAVTAPFPPDAN
ncbi:MAG: DUF6522 family protein [Oceanicaulis sp.]|jgi:hypothetical protein|nr:hypothetical protein [Oceanicaulis sp.]MCH8488980.1 DUF6522 family protein [Oceanicaulis sp.]